MNDVGFMRALGLFSIHREARLRYQLVKDSLVIPEVAFENPMVLIPMSQVNQWYTQLEVLSKNPDVILDISRETHINDIGNLSHWLLSGTDLASTIRRLNYGITSLQGGAFLSGSLTGSIIKWAYRNTGITVDAKVHDSVRVAMVLVKILRLYLGDDYAPLRVLMSGSRKNNHKYRDYFGCDVEWNHSQTEVWFHSEDRLATQQQNYVKKGRLAMSFSDLDELLNMPATGDEVKVIYEIINYSRLFGLPNIEHVSELLGLSVQQFQRRLRKLGMNFTTVSGYVLSNLAVSMMAQGTKVDDIANQLGYQNTASFNRMFKKHRGLTPNQYVQRFHG